ncbi:hypothetical protein MPSYJ_42540 [Mycolicibacterium psychrotolerans]|uniref:Uncharacterized protein n=1 Tax=Mycolicibacterium psychrotolerans TaxID=216929 RepID=A0A7I7MGY4_9MYCO|nr:hypothetical protein MPSYJ_42540 [Mycolicibacterium psychrotolerans]
MRTWKVRAAGPVAAESLGLLTTDVTATILRRAAMAPAPASPQRIAEFGACWAFPG